MRTLKAERETLAKVRDMLETDAVHVMVASEEKRHVNCFGFSMGMTCQTYDCGTVACIGGHAWLVENPKDLSGADDFVIGYEPSDDETRTGLSLLFYPPVWLMRYREITPAHASQAISNYLDTGDPLWGQILPPDGSQTIVTDKANEEN